MVPFLERKIGPEADAERARATLAAVVTAAPTKVEASTADAVKCIPRETCILTGSREPGDLEDLFILEKMPVSMYCVDGPIEEDARADMKWSISKSAGCVQLSNLVPLDVLYQHEHGSGVVGGVWKDHHQQFCDFLAAHGVRRPLEIGAGHGILAKQFLKKYDGKDCDKGIAAGWVIVEPNLPSWRHERVSMVAGMFDKDFKLPPDIPSVDAVVHSHTFEHIYSPREFLEDVSRFLDVGQKHLFSLPRLDLWLERGYSNALNFEHTILLTEGIIEQLLRSTGFAVIEKKYFREDHSIFYATEKVKDPLIFGETGRENFNEYVANKALFSDFISKQQANVMRINKQLAAEKGEVYLFGAHVFSQFLIGFGLDTSRVVCIIDNDKNKHGKRLYGTKYTVCPTDAVKQAERPLVVLCACAYRDEIVRGIRENVREDVGFVE